MIAGRLTMRARIMRNTQAETDDWGGKAAPDYQPLGTLPCFVWSKSSREIVDGTKDAAIEDMQAMFELRADIAENDRIADIKDRTGAVIIPGTFTVEGPVRRVHTHQQASLKRVN